MKTARMLALAALMTVAISASANAGGFVWAEASGGTGGGPGAPLLLDCDTSAPAPTRCEWLITIFYQTDGYGGGSWSLDLYQDPAFLDKVTVKQFNYSETATNDPSDPANNTAPDSVNANGFLLQSMGSLTFQPTAAGTWPLFQFILSKNKLPGDTNIYNIGIGVGFNEFGGDDSNGYEVVGFGPNPPREGTYTGEAEGNPIITIRNTPEPTTLALVGLGLVGLVRRRR
ncbi:MAG TPA: PEP-CTERM sorting domain-containing protein [Phycisphaerae bacterium]|nr:PEP-CTERM sorting domain-containing protein [Phycisphaerae bacterium]